MLDIFGFEVFGRNSLEQLLINFCNEKLQGIFNRLVVIDENARYAEEGLPPLQLNTTGLDNVACREVLDAPEKGLLQLLELECQIPKGTDRRPAG